MAEYASADEERRGTANNRWLLSVMNFCQFQQKVNAEKQNQIILKEKAFTVLYTKIGVLSSTEEGNDEERCGRIVFPGR